MHSASLIYGLLFGFSDCISSVPPLICASICCRSQGYAKPLNIVSCFFDFLVRKAQMILLTIIETMKDTSYDNQGCPRSLQRRKIEAKFGGIDRCLK